MTLLVGGRTESDLPGLDIAEHRSWANFLGATTLLHNAVDRGLMDRHSLRLDDVRLLNLLDRSETGSVRMGDIAESLMSRPSRLTRQIGRLEDQGLVKRHRIDTDRRGVSASITADGRALIKEARTTYAFQIRAHFLDPLSRAQMAALGDNCRRISAALKNNGVAVKNQPLI